MSISAIERTVLAAILEGDFPVLPELRRQIDYLTVCSRRRSYHNYLMKFGATDGLSSELSGTIVNSKIGGTVIVLQESEEKIVASLNVKMGAISGLMIGGPYDFTKDFTISSFYWENSRIVDSSEGRKAVLDAVYDANLRDWKSAISYIATYR